MLKVALLAAELINNPQFEPRIDQEYDVTPLLVAVTWAIT